MQIAQLLSDFPKRSLALLILLAGVQSQAMTLGRIQGAALIGRPLVVSIAVQAEAGQNLGISCFEADVFHGDNKQDPTKVKLRLEPSASGQGDILRVTSDTPVNEPIVTVYLRAVCTQAISRRYVMLADIVSEQAAPVAPRVGAVPLVIPAPTPSAASLAAQAAAATAPTLVAPPTVSTSTPNVASTGQGAEVRRVPGAGQPAAAKTATRRPSKVATPKPAPTSPVAAKPAVVAVEPAPVKPAAASASATAPEEKSRAGRTAGQSRLRLDPLELLSERVATLESFSASAPAEIAAREARDAQRLDSLEASVKSLVALAAKNEVSLLELRARLERAQAERYNNAVVYLLVALLLVSLLAIAYLLSRSSRRAQQEPADNWWDGSAARQTSEARASAPVGLPAEEPSVAYREPDSGLSVISQPSPLSQPNGLSPSGPAAVLQTQPMTQGLPLRHAGAVPAQVDVSLVEMSESTFDRLMQSGTAHSAVRKSRDDEMAFGTAGPGAAAADGGVLQGRRIDSDELVDVRQRAEFFVSLGQTDQAVQVLEARIAKDSTSCPQAYLDLLKLFHSLGLKADFLHVRDDFTQIFNVQVPEFTDFEEEGRNLEDYPGTVDRLIAVWDRASVLDVIEHLLYRQEGDTSHQPFDLAGFRDLLTLHAVSQAVRGADAANAGADRGPHFPPLGAAQVDIDLSELMVAPSELRTGLSASTDAAARGPAADDNLIDFDLTEVPPEKKPGAR